jgi:hypothetical protein
MGNQIKVCLLLMLGFFAMAVEASSSRRFTDSSPMRTGELSSSVPRGGATRSNVRVRSRNRSFLGWREKTAIAKESIIEFTTDRTYFSRDLMPQSMEDAEWAAFLKGWLLIALPIPLPLLFVALAADSTLLHFSTWDDAIKHKYVVGLYHGIFCFAVVLKEMADMEDIFNRPRNVLILLNIATNLFLGKIGRYKATKNVMDVGTFGTLFHILYSHFQTPLLGDAPGRRWYLN